MYTIRYSVLGAARKDEHRGKTKEINPRCKKVSPPCITLNCTGEKLLRKMDNIAVSKFVDYLVELDKYRTLRFNYPY